jgi:hypothetical protein
MVRDTTVSLRRLRKASLHSACSDARLPTLCGRFLPHNTISSEGAALCAAYRRMATSNTIPAALSAPEVVQNHVPLE